MTGCKTAQAAPNARLLVAHLHVPPHQEIQQLTIFPEISQLQARNPLDGWRTKTDSAAAVCIMASMGG